MGWGTFVAGQVIGSVRRSTRGLGGSTSSVDVIAYGIAGVFLLRGFYQKSYVRRVLRKTVLIHPEIEAVTDWETWEEDITKRADHDWYAMLIIAAVINGVWLAFAPWGLFLSIPVSWYYGKAHLIKRYVAEINNNFLQKGYDVYRLESEIPSVLQRFRDEEAQAEIALKSAEKKRREQMAKERELKKFGK